MKSKCKHIDAVLLAERNARKESIYQQVKDESFLHPEKKEEKNLPGITERKGNDIFSQPSSPEFLLLKPEAEDSTSTGQKRVEVHYLEKGKVYSKPFQSKMPMEIDHPLEPEPRVKVQLPKPEPRGEETPEDYASPLDKLARLDKHCKDKNFGFYGKGFRSSHGQSLNFWKFRKANTVGHPNARFDIDETDFVQIYISRSQLRQNIFIRRPFLMAAIIIV